MECIETEILVKPIEGLYELADLLPLEKADKKRLLEPWIEQQEDAVSISLWLEESDEPIRVFQKGFWNRPEMTQLHSEGRRTVLSYLFQNRLPEPDGRDWWTGPMLEADLLGYSILSFGIRRKNDPIQVLELKKRLEGFDEFLDGILEDREQFMVFIEGGEVLYTTNTALKVPETTPDSSTVIRNAKNETVYAPFLHLPWHYVLERESVELPKPVAGLARMNRMLLIRLILLIIILGILLSIWIDRPLKKLINTATDIARGDFLLRIPNQKNRTLDRLSKIFNYMAEEMEHLQGLDVGEIINEKNKTETILRNIADGVVVTDPDNRILVMNAVAEKWFGLNERDILHHPVEDCIKSESLNTLLHDVKNGKSIDSAEFTFDAIDARPSKVFQANAAAVRNPEDKLVGVVTVLRDVTKEREADRIKTELVSMVAHELKSPLTSIYGFSELLLESDLQDPQSTEYAKVILNESTRLTDLVNKFLDLSRLEAGRTEIKMMPFDLGQVVDKITSHYHAQAEEKEIKVIADIPEDYPLAMGDPDMIEQVLLNLYSNAIKYSPKRSKIGIELKKEGEKLTVSVIDNGYGIPREALPHIFDKFYRVVDTEDTEEVEGSGLGLTLAKVIVEQHGGNIKVNSRLGVGSVFSFSLKPADTV